MDVIFYISVYIGIVLLVFWLWLKLDKTFTEEDINFLGGISLFWPISIPFILIVMFPDILSWFGDAMSIWVTSDSH